MATDVPYTIAGAVFALLSFSKAVLLVAYEKIKSSFSSNETESPEMWNQLRSKIKRSETRE